VAIGQPPAGFGHHDPGGRETAGAFGRRGRGRQRVPLLPATGDRRVLPRGRIPGLGDHRPSPGPTVRARLRPAAPDRIANAAAGLWLLVTQATNVYVLASTALSIGVPAAAISASILWFRHTIAGGRSRDA
jgi:hypothetical protein